MLSLVLLGFLNGDSIVFSYLIQLIKSCPQFSKLVNLLVTELLSLAVVLLQLGQLLCQECQPLCSVLHLAQDIWLALIDDLVKLLLSPELVYLKLSLELFLLLDLLLCSLQIFL